MFKTDRSPTAKLRRSLVAPHEYQQNRARGYQWTMCWQGSGLNHVGVGVVALFKRRSDAVARGTRAMAGYTLTTRAERRGNALPIEVERGCILVQQKSMRVGQMDRRVDLEDIVGVDLEDIRMFIVQEMPATRNTCLPRSRLILRGRARFTASDALKEECHDGAEARRPLDPRCPNHPSHRAPQVFTRMTYTTDMAGLYYSHCIPCKRTFYAPQKGPSPEQKARIDALRVAEQAQADERREANAARAAERAEMRRLQASHRAHGMQERHSKRLRTQDNANTPTVSNVTTPASTQTSHAGAAGSPVGAASAGGREPLRSCAFQAMNVQNRRVSGTQVETESLPPSSPPMPDPDDSDDGGHGPLIDRCGPTILRVVFFTNPGVRPNPARIETRTLLVALSSLGRFMQDHHLHMGQQWERWSFERCSWEGPLEMDAVIRAIPGQTIMGRLVGVRWDDSGVVGREGCRGFAAELMHAKMSILGMAADRGDDAGDGAGDDDDDDDDDDDRGEPPSRPGVRARKQDKENQPPYPPPYSVLDPTQSSASTAVIIPRPGARGPALPERRKKRKLAPRSEPVAGPSRQQSPPPAAGPSTTTFTRTIKGFWDGRIQNWVIDVDAQRDDDDETERSRGKKRRVEPEDFVDLTQEDEED
ncbi:hypothetical protein BV25DRAFT_1840275 [Artomyces pyxidatus]|uniref:Uncharacterized protein n=1 Tax=Artomyces pyxidatus TaxID=48021 RepID=A0ACB8SUQ5_9AGAM|nr:hypothetical protein BV25DRAFT_1840275 [Artomyces pyxidatus]